MEELKIGSVVYLNSDRNMNHLMTINGQSADGKDYWYCVWFRGQELVGGSFHKDALTSY